MQDYQVSFWSPSWPWPSGWRHRDHVADERFSLGQAEANASTLVLAVRARNRHGLSPPSPTARVVFTAVNAHAHRDVATANVVHLKEAVAVGSRKIEVKWEVRAMTSAGIIYKIGFCL